MSSKLLGLYLLVVAILIVGGGVGYRAMQNTLPQHYHGALIKPSMQIPEFKLSSIDGSFSNSQLESNFTLLTFGFVNCPHICPMTMQRLARVRSSLAASDVDVPLQVVLITVDPVRDSVSNTDSFAKQFHQEFIGLGGMAKEIREAANAFGVYFEKEKQIQDGGSYLMGHSTTVFGVDAKGRIALVWGGGHTASQIAEDISEYFD